jgi:hypothetical protein
MTIDCELTEDDFLVRFKPVPNPIDPDAGFDGSLFETFGDDSPMCRPRIPTWSGSCSTVRASSRSPADSIS